VTVNQSASSVTVQLIFELTVKLDWLSAEEFNVRLDCDIERARVIGLNDSGFSAQAKTRQNQRIE
jgi:hypothetical protein